MGLTVRQLQALQAEYKAATKPRVPAPPPDEPPAPPKAPEPPPPAPACPDVTLVAEAVVAAVDEGELDERAVELVGSADRLAAGEVPAWAAKPDAWASARAAVEDALGHPRGAALDRDGLVAAAATYARITEV